VELLIWAQLLFSFCPVAQLALVFGLFLYDIVLFIVGHELESATLLQALRVIDIASTLVRTHQPVARNRFLAIKPPVCAIGAILRSSNALLERKA
jgi:hypothetical protein